MSESTYDPDFYPVHFPLSEAVDPRAIQTLLNDGLSKGWTTRQSGETDVCKYAGSLTEFDPKLVPTKDAIVDLGSSSSGYIKLFSETTAFGLGIDELCERDDLSNLGGVEIWWDHIRFKEGTVETVEEVYDIVSFAFDRLPAPFAFSRIPNDLEYETEVTMQHVTEPRLPDVYWLTLLSEELCDDIGRSRLESAPVWKAEPLGCGGFGLVVTDHPYDYGREDKQRVRDHLGLDD